MTVSSLAEDTCLKNQAPRAASTSPAETATAAGPSLSRSSDVEKQQQDGFAGGYLDYAASPSPHLTAATKSGVSTPGESAAEMECLAPAPVRLQLTRSYASYGGTGAGFVPPDPGHRRRPSAASAAPSASSTTPTNDYGPRVTFPEGGLQAWLVVLGSFCAMFCVFGLINTAAVFESWFSTHQLARYSASEIGWIFSLYLFIVFFVGIQVGPLFDCYGPRWLVLAGSLLMVASILLLGLCASYYQVLLCYSVLGGLGGALLNTPAYACIAHYFNVRRGLATGVALTSGGIGGVVFPILLQYLLPRLGFAWSTRILGFMLLALAVPANLWLRTRLPLAGPAGLASDGSASIRGRRIQSVWPDFTIFRDKCYTVAAAGVFFMEWGIFVPLTFVVSYGSAHGQSVSASYTLLSLLNAGSVLGRFLPGLLADKLGRFNVIIVTIALSSLMVFAIWLPAGSSHAAMIAFAVLFGFASGSNLGLIAVCLGQLCEPREYGRYYSTAMMVASFGTLSSVPIGGALLSSGTGEKGWQALIAFSGASYAVALACYVAARVMAVGWRFTEIF